MYVPIITFDSNDCFRVWKIKVLLHFPNTGKRIGYDYIFKSQCVTNSIKAPFVCFPNFGFVKLVNTILNKEHIGFNVKPP